MFTQLTETKKNRSKKVIEEFVSVLLGLCTASEFSIVRVLFFSSFFFLSFLVLSKQDLLTGKAQSI
jgi:hypothetical protein